MDSLSCRPSTPPAALISATASSWPRSMLLPVPGVRPVSGAPEPITIGRLLEPLLAARDDDDDEVPPKYPPSAAHDQAADARGAQRRAGSFSWSR